MTDETQETAGMLLDSLSRGNPKYQEHIYRALIALMTCSSPRGQQLVLHILRTVQVKPVTHKVYQKALCYCMHVHTNLVFHKLVFSL